MRRKLAVKPSRKRHDDLGEDLARLQHRAARSKEELLDGNQPLAALRLQAQRCAEHQQRRRAVKRGHGRAQIAADGGLVAGLHRANLKRGFGDGRQLQPNLRMRAKRGKGYQGADSGLVRLKDDVVQAAVGEIDEIIYVLDPAAQPGNQVGSPGQNLRFLFLKAVEGA